MIGLMGQLFTGKADPHNSHINQASRLLFRSITGQTSRVKIMMALLELAPQNAEKSANSMT
jgi:hypothetical protein